MIDELFSTLEAEAARHPDPESWMTAALAVASRVEGGVVSFSPHAYHNLMSGKYTMAGATPEQWERDRQIDQQGGCGCSPPLPE